MTSLSAISYDFHTGKHLFLLQVRRRGRPGSEKEHIALCSRCGLQLLDRKGLAEMVKFDPAAQLGEPAHSSKVRRLGELARRRVVRSRRAGLVHKQAEGALPARHGDPDHFCAHLSQLTPWYCDDLFGAA